MTTVVEWGSRLLFRPWRFRGQQVGAIVLAGIVRYNLRRTKPQFAGLMLGRQQEKVVTRTATGLGGGGPLSL